MQSKNENTFLNVKIVLLILVSILVVLYSINVYKEGQLIGSSASNVISVSGTGEIDVKPDLATISLTVRESNKDTKQAEILVSERTQKLLTSLKGVIEDKDIKTDSYTSYPRYSYPINSAPKIDGYETTQNISIKVRDTENVSKVIALISSAGIKEVSGPNYTIDDDGDYKDIARKEAIDDAKDKAELLAKQLGVKLVRIVSFSESDYSPMYPVMYKANSMSLDAAAPEALPTLPTGENTIKSNVNITYEIK